jgi:2-haloacid dehalogenase
MLDFSRFELLSFDCYGTLIDWESGLLAFFRELLAHHRHPLTDAEILGSYSEFEAETESGAFIKYKSVLAKVTRAFAARYGLELKPSEEESLAASIAHWPPFPDTVPALRRLKSRYKLAIISNIDDDLFAATARRLEVPFDFVVTAEKARSYKPSFNNFHVAEQRFHIGKEEWLHCAQSLFHDIAPTNALGIANVWVNRRAGKEGLGATKSGTAEPKLRVTSLKELADRAGV